MSSVSSVNSLLSSTATDTGSSINVSSILQAASGSTSTGIDVTAAVTAALYAARAPERAWQAQQATLASQTTALTAIKTATQAVQTDIKSLNSVVGPFSSRTVTSSYSSLVSATAASGTSVGNHTITVSQLAATASWYSDTAASPTAALPATSFTLTNASGTSATFSTGSGVNTLKDLASAINSQNLGVSADVVTDISGSRLALVSNVSGKDGDFSISSSNYTGTSWNSSSLADGQTLGADTMTFTVNGTANNVTVTNGETLSQLANSINGQNIGVTASVVSDSNGSHLSVVSSDGSTPFTINQPSYGFSQAVKGTNANLTVDGIPVSSATNKVTGAISGVTLNLSGVTTAVGSVSLGIAANTTQISSAISQLVTDYNTAVQQVNSQFSYNSSTSSQGVLGGDSTVRSLQQTLLSALNFVATPASGTTTTVSTLSDLGITQSQDGTLTLASDTLNTALTNNPADVQNFFLGNNLNGFANSVVNQLDTFLHTGTGAFTVDLNSISQTNTGLTSQINDFENIYIANQKTLLTAMYTKAEIALQQLPTQMQQLQAELGNNSKS